MSKINLYQALLAAQREMPPVKETSRNPGFGGSRYADLEQVISTITPILHKNGLIFTQCGSMENGQSVLVTNIIHVESGEMESSSFPIISKDPGNPQSMGSSITYAKRYGLLAILGIATTDDDGNAGAAAPERQSYTQQAQTPRPQQNQPSPIDFAAMRGRQDGQAPSTGLAVTPKQLKFIQAIAREKGVSDDHLNGFMREWFGAENVAVLNRADASAAIGRLTDLPAFTSDSVDDSYYNDPVPFSQGAAAPPSQPANSSINRTLVQPGSNAESGMSEGAERFWMNKIENASTQVMIKDVFEAIEERFGDNITDVVANALLLKSNALGYNV